MKTINHKVAIIISDFMHVIISLIIKSRFLKTLHESSEKV